MSYPEIAALLPHDAPMRLIDTLLAALLCWVNEQRTHQEIGRAHV